MTTTKKLLIGCGLGCGTLVLVAIGAAISFAVWVARPGELLEPERLLGADTRGYLEWRLALEDPGTEGFAELLIESLRNVPPGVEESMPPWLGRWILGRRARELESDVRQMFPMVAVWTLHADAATADDIHLFSASLKNFGNRLVFADWLLGLFWGRDDETVTHEHNGERIYEIVISRDTKFAFFLRSSNAFFTTDVATARQAVDRLLATTVPGRETTRLDRLFDHTERSDTMRGAVVNERGETERLLRNIWLADSEGVDTDFWATLGGVSLSAGLRADGSLSGVLEFHGPDAAWATLHAASVTAALEAAFRDLDIKAEVNGVAIAERIRVRCRVPELVQRLAQLVSQDFETEDGRKIRVGFEPGCYRAM